MRKDILDVIRTVFMKGIKPNFSKLARQYNCDPRTVKRYFIEGESATKRKTRIYTSIIEPFADIVIEKIADGASAKAIHSFLKSKGFKGGYSTVKRFCRNYKQKKTKSAVIRFETQPGLQAQVDWKEKLKLENKHGVIFEINIFLVLLGYSRYKYLMLTTDRTQPTVFKGLLNSFKYFGGVPKEILFDNMKTVVDQSRTQYGKPVYNERFYEFTKDAGFIPRSCLAYKPQTKGKVESLAKLMNRLLVYNHEFESLEDLNEIVKKFNEEINNEISQGTGQKPIERFKEEQSNLNPLPRSDVFEDYLDLRPNKRKVTSEAMISIDGIKYSVPPQYINSEVFYQIKDNQIEILDLQQIPICRHKISTRKLNYTEEHYKAIAQKSLNNSDTIMKVCKANLSLYDKL